MNQAKLKVESANKLQKQGRIEEARTLYLEVLKLTPNYVPALAKLAAIYEKFEQWQYVSELCKQIVSIQPKNVGAYLKLAQALREEGNINGAISTYQQAISLHSDPFQAYLKLGDLLGEANQLEEQIAAYSKAIKLKPELEQAHRKLAQVIIKKNGKIEALAKVGLCSQTIAFYQELINLPLLLDDRTIYSNRIHSNLGKLIIAQSVRSGNFSEAVRFFQKSTSVDSSNAWYLYYLGQCKEREEQIDEALNCYYKAIQCQQSFAEAHICIGSILTRKREWDLAFESYLRASKFKPNDLNLWDALRQYFKLIRNNLSPEKVKAKALAYQNSLTEKSACHVKILMQAGLTVEAIDLNKKICFDIVSKNKPDYIQNFWDFGETLGPNFFIIGVMKCGTSALYDYMIQHPNILPSILKEPNSLGLDRSYTEFYESIDYYLSLFPPLPASREFYTGEASTRYIYSKYAIKNIIQHFSKSKLIVVLRNPVKRLISQYFFMVKREKLKSGSLEKVLNQEFITFKRKTEFKNIYQDGIKTSNFLIHGLYFNFLKKWMSVFPKEQFLILRNEDLSTNPAAVMSQVFEFLGVPDYRNLEYARKNTTTYPSQIDERLLTRLQDFYRPHNQKLEEFLGRKFNWD